MEILDEILEILKTKSMDELQNFLEKFERIFGGIPKEIHDEISVVISGVILSKISLNS